MESWLNLRLKRVEDWLRGALARLLGRGGALRTNSGRETFTRTAALCACPETQRPLTPIPPLPPPPPPLPPSLPVFTLPHVRRDPSLSDWKLFLVDWGYNTPAERARAAAHPAITVVDKQQFVELLQP